MATLKNTTITDGGYFRLPAGGSPLRPSPATNGTTRFNTDSGLVETWNGSTWVNNINLVVSSESNVQAGVNNAGAGFRIQYFTSPGPSTFNVPTGVTQVHVLVVAGGGSGGHQVGGAGGAGGMIEAMHYPVVPGGTVGVTVGAGGPAPGFQPSNNISYNGSDSVFGLLTAKGGGGGGNHSGGSQPGLPGGSGGGGGGGPGGNGGGSATQPVGGSGTVYTGLGAVGWGYPGGSGHPGGNWSGGGGGGAGSQGGNAGPNLGGQGGMGRVSYITGQAQYFAGGGGGNAESPGNPMYGRGGQGGGGQGSNNDFSKSNNPECNGKQYTGGGGGGSRDHPGGGGNGGPGIVIVRY